jgi:thioredoxin-dependent peroxiredoxin
MNFIAKLFRKSVKVGQVAPDFSLPNQDGAPVRLQDFRGKRNVVLYFYPKDDTYGCIAESSEFRDQYEIFKRADAEILGVSSDGPASHISFAKTYRLPFTLLSDEKNEVRRLYGVRPTAGIIPGRVTFVIDKQGVVRHVFDSQFSPKSHVSQAIETLEKIHH